MFRYANGRDKCCMILGSIAALGTGFSSTYVRIYFLTGAGLPLFSIFFGNVIN